MQAQILKQIEDQLAQSAYPFVEGEAPTSLDVAALGML